MANVIENEGWRVADQVANLLTIDREVCRKAFYQEPEERVREVVRWVLAERDLSGHDIEQMIEDWARRHGAGVYAENRRCGSLEHVEEIVPRTILGCSEAA